MSSAGLTNSTSNSTSTSHPHHHHDAAHIDLLLNSSISDWAPFSAMILTITGVVIFAYRLYFVEMFLMNTKLYKANYERLSEDQKRSLVNHHVAGTCKITLLITAIYPFLSVAFGKANPHTPWVIGSKVTMGDIMVICTQIFTMMYVFELFYRSKVSPISAAHHVGAIVIAQTAVAISLDFNHERDAVIEFVMCFVWGAFDVIAELWPHVAMILYRLLPAEDDHSQHAQRFHSLMSRIFFSVAIMEVAGTTVETIVVFILFGSLWEKWELTFKIVTPVLHVLFSCAQAWGAWVFWNLSRKEAKKAAGLQRSASVSADAVEKPDALIGGGLLEYDGRQPARHTKGSSAPVITTTEIEL